MKESHFIQSVEELGQQYTAPLSSSTGKVKKALSPAMIRWLTFSPFFVLSSISEDGIDCSPRGDLPGDTFRVLDEHTIAIPDRRGNNRVDTLKNIITDPRVGLVFLIPGIEEALRIKGSARISIAPELLQAFALNDELPATVMLISVQSAYVQNARAIRAARLWDKTADIALQTVPTAHDLYE